MKTTLLGLAFAVASCGLASGTNTPGAPGYYCERRIGRKGEYVPHHGICARDSEPCNRVSFIKFPEVTNAVRPFRIPGACGGLPADVTCCIAPLPEPGAVFPPNLSEEMPDGITGEQLSCCMKVGHYGFPESYKNRYLPDLNRSFKAFGMTKRSEIAAFLAQTGSESGSLQYWTELGNDNCGGYRGGCTYKGRGPIQLTHNYNYRDALRWLRGQGILTNADEDDIVKYPTKVAEPKYGWLTTMWFWRISKRLEQYADNSWENFIWMSKRINGGLRGIHHRSERWAKCVQCLGGTSPNYEAYRRSTDEKCHRLKGECREQDDCNGGTQVSGKCAGRTTKCCIKQDNRAPCDVIQGTCSTGSCSGGTKVRGLCSGAAVCCVPGGSAVQEGITTDPEVSEEEVVVDNENNNGGGDDEDEEDEEVAQNNNNNNDENTGGASGFNECQETGGTCVASGQSCSGYAVIEAGQLGCGSGSRCCRPKCSDVLGVCRGENDCSGGSQQSRLCPGSGTKCCIRGSNASERRNVLRTESIRRLGGNPDTGANTGTNTPVAPSVPECVRTAGTCTARSRGCSGYAVENVGTLGCGSSEICCRPKCSNRLGFCRAANDCSQGTQESMLCPGTSKCCIQGDTDAAKRVVMEAQALSGIPDDDLLIAEAARPSTEDIDAEMRNNGGRFGNHLGRSKIPINGGDVNQVLRSAKRNGEAVEKNVGETSTEEFSENVDPATASAEEAKRKAKRIGVREDEADVLMTEFEEMLERAREASVNYSVDKEAIYFIANTAGGKGLFRVYDFWTNTFNFDPASYGRKRSATDYNRRKKTAAAALLAFTADNGELEKPTFKRALKRIAESKSKFDNDRGVVYSTHASFSTVGMEKFAANDNEEGVDRNAALATESTTSASTSANEAADNNVARDIAALDRDLKEIISK